MSAWELEKFAFNTQNYPSKNNYDNIHSKVGFSKTFSGGKGDPSNASSSFKQSVISSGNKNSRKDHILINVEHVSDDSFDVDNKHPKMGVKITKKNSRGLKL